MEDQCTRRAALSLAGGLAIGSIGIAATTNLASAATTETFSIMSGTAHETTVYVRTAGADGPTVMVVGGMHGSETAGYEAAERLTDLAIDRGQLVVVPRANEAAIENNSRTGEDDVDLNRQFPVGGEPRTELASALWGVVEEYQPDEFIDLHESVGIYDGEDVADGAGQAIFHTRNDAARQEAAAATDYLNANHVDTTEYEFTIGPFSDEDGDLDGLFAHKVTRDTDARAFLVETFSGDPPLDQRIEWHTAAVQQLTADELQNGNGAPTATETRTEEPTDTPEPNEPPVAEISSDPANAEQVDFSWGDTVVLDASGSSDPDGEIGEYRWAADGVRGFEESGPTVEVTLDFCGELAVGLQVTDDDGATTTDDIVLSTAR